MGPDFVMGPPDTGYPPSVFVRAARKVYAASSKWFCVLSRPFSCGAVRKYTLPVSNGSNVLCFVVLPIHFLAASPKNIRYQFPMDL